MTDLPIIMGLAGLIPQAPADLRAQLIALVAATSPGYTANLPGSLIDDISGTDVGAIVLCDQFRVDLINSLTPYGANAFLLNQLGQVYGVPIGLVSNTSVFVVFTGTVGYVVAQGFIISDGANQYTLTDGGIIRIGGTTIPLQAIATAPGSFAIPPNTVINLVTSVPSPIVLTVTNPLAGSPGAGAETEGAYRTRVLQAGLAPSTGTLRYLKTLLTKIIGVQQRLVAVRAVGINFEIICGGAGDPYQIAYAIYTALFDVLDIVGSTMGVASITKANPGVVVTTLNHGYTTGQVAQINGALGMTAINGAPFTATVIDQKTFSIGIDTTAYGVYTGSGVLTPNFRNTSATINDYPDTYNIPFVIPPLQQVTIAITWNTTATSVVSNATVAALAQPAIADYVNGIYAGQPMNLYSLESTFRNAIMGILTPELLTRLVFTVSINGVVTPPAAGTGVIAGDPESYFSMVPTGATVIQG